MTEELKKAFEAAVTDEQKKAVAEKFKEEISKLSEDELDKVTGGDLIPYTVHLIREKIRAGV